MENRGLWRLRGGDHMKHVVEVLFNFTVDAPAGTDTQELEREVFAAARNALDAGMVSLTEDRLVKTLVTTSGLQELWRWSREIPASPASTLVALLVAATLRDRHEVLSPDQQRLLDTAVYMQAADPFKTKKSGRESGNEQRRGDRERGY